ncbi:hypothetical protein [Methylohalobius crimeensis]|uniref:hypothetical protein n=1 Tax=Methylohalobius crimeensis TaxID=244365 RepID=UPI0003B793AD|nr:hypothetical protein [Methylohalobius crimeensis]
MVERNSLNILKEALLPTTTVHQHRCRIFQASKRPTNQIKEIKTSWGKVKVKGRLGQVHATLIETIMNNAINKKEVDGCIYLLIDFYTIRRKLTDKKNHYSYETIHKLLDDIMTTLLDVTIPNRRISRVKGHLIDEVCESNKLKFNPFGGERKLWVVKIGRVGRAFLRDDIPLYYDVESINQTKHGISQAVARHVLSHSKTPAGGWRIDTLIIAASGDLSAREMRKARWQIRSDAKELREIGIEVDDDRIKRI